MGNDNSSIIVCGKRYDIGQRVIVWEDDPSISAYTLHCVSKPSVIFPTQPAKGLGTIAARFRERRLIGADKSLSRLQQVLKQFVVHHDGMGTSRDTFRVLHDERGLSVHFLIDNNGDVYQTLDLVDCGFQAAGVNEISVGVELCNRGDAQQFPEFYHGKRDKVTCTINKHQFLCYVYTDAQMQAMTNIGKCLARVLPGLAQAFPQDATGEQLWDTVAGDPRDFSGYLGHYHVTDRKWDPGPFDFKKFVTSIRGRMFFPAIPSKTNAEIPAETEKAEELAQELIANNENNQFGSGGYYPIGPYGETALWHSGLHMRDDRGAPIATSFAGKIVAARFKSEADWPAIGSNNFVLIKHEMAVGGAAIKFFTVLAHLDSEDFEGDKMPSWLMNGKEKTWFAKLKAGETILLEESVGAGQVVGHFGVAGPRNGKHGQVHFEILSEEELGAKIGDTGYWMLVESSPPTNRFAPAAISARVEIPATRDGIVTGKEIEYCFRQPVSPEQKDIRDKFRKMAIHHLSEWGGEDKDFLAALGSSNEIKQLLNQRHQYSAAGLNALYVNQIQSMFWWTDEVEKHAGLPPGRMVWNYHPITFVLWIYEKLKGQVSAAKAIASAESFKGEKPPSDIKDDASEGAEGFMDDEDALFGEAAKSLTLDRLAEGYPD